MPASLLTLLGGIGVLRFPDVYTRIHAASLTDTGGATLVLLGLGLISGLTAETLKLALVWVFVMLTTPAAANALANAAFSAGHTPRIGTFQIMKGVDASQAKPETPDERRRQERGAMTDIALEANFALNVALLLMLVIVASRSRARAACWRRSCCWASIRWSALRGWW